MLRSFLPGKSATPVIICSQVKQLAFHAVQSAAHLSPVQSALLQLVPAVHALPSGLAAHQHAMLNLPLQSEAAVTAHHERSEAQHAQRAGVQQRVAAVHAVPAQLWHLPAQQVLRFCMHA